MKLEMSTKNILTGVVVALALVLVLVVILVKTVSMCQEWKPCPIALAPLTKTD